jgi:two-component sensor histidine kinase
MLPIQATGRRPALREAGPDIMPKTALPGPNESWFQRFQPALYVLWQVVCGIGVAALTAFGRTLIDRTVPGAAPYILLPPAVLLSTLLAGWRAGLLTEAIVLVLAWRFLLRPAGFSFFHAGDATSFALEAISGLLVVFVAQSFRSMSRRALSVRAEQLAQRDLHSRELDHRVRNMLALFSSMIEVQRRRTIDPAAQDALAQVSTRLQSIAAAHRELYRGDDDVSKIDLVAYLDELCRHLSGALFADVSAQLQTDLSGRVRIDRDRAVAIGLVVNELVTNAAKHAHNDGATIVRVSLTCVKSECTLTVADNGPGLPAAAETSAPGAAGGLGRGLIAAFIQQAEGELTAHNQDGARFELRFRV